MILTIEVTLQTNKVTFSLTAETIHQVCTLFFFLINFFFCSFNQALVYSSFASVGHLFYWLAQMTIKKDIDILLFFIALSKVCLKPLSWGCWYMFTSALEALTYLFSGINFDDYFQNYLEGLGLFSWPESGRGYVRIPSFWALNHRLPLFLVVSFWFGIG